MRLPIYNRCGFQINEKLSWRPYLLTIPNLDTDKSILTVAAEDCQPLLVLGRAVEVLPFLCPDV